MSDLEEKKSEGSDTAEQAAEIIEPKEEEAKKRRSTISEPEKVMRIGTMIKQLLDEVKSAEMDEAGRDRLKEIYETSVEELASSLSPDLTDELNRLALPFEEGVPSGSELRIAQAQLVGWLEGLFHGIQATLFAQQNIARQQLEQMQTQALPAGAADSAAATATSGGVYL